MGEDFGVADVGPVAGEFEGLDGGAGLGEGADGVGVIKYLSLYLPFICRVPLSADYAFDCHTLKGKRKGKTKTDFFRDEQRALKPFQPGLFDDLPES